MPGGVAGAQPIRAAPYADGLIPQNGEERAEGEEREGRGRHEGRCAESFMTMAHGQNRVDAHDGQRRGENEGRA